MIALLAVWLALPAVPAAEPDAFAAALRCRAYAPVASALLPKLADGRRFGDYWIKRTEALGRSQGRTVEQVAASTLVIQIRADDADATIAECLKQWGAAQRRP